MSINFYAGQIVGGVEIDMVDELGQAELVRCTVSHIPSAVAGYQAGCELIATDTGNHYYNTGTSSSCSFVAGGTIGALTVTTASIQANAVTLAKLASGVTPSHIVKYAGKITWSGSGDSLVTTVTGVAATDVVMATIQGAPTESANLISVVPTLNTITITLSAANTSNDAVIAYTVFRAAA